MKKTNYCLVSEKIKNPDRCLRKIKNGKALFPNFYIVTFVNNSDRVEILNSLFFFFKYNRDQQYEVMALLTGEDEALEYVRRLTEISYGKYGSFNPRKTIEEMTDEDFLKLKATGED